MGPEPAQAEQGVSPNYIRASVGGGTLARSAMNDRRDVTSAPPPPQGPIACGFNELTNRLRAGHEVVSQLEQVLFPILAAPGPTSDNIAKSPGEPIRLTDRLDHQIRSADALVGRLIELMQRVQL